jgi:hypothetical protein
MGLHGRRKLFPRVHGRSLFMRAVLWAPSVKRLQISTWAGVPGFRSLIPCSTRCSSQGALLEGYGKVEAFRRWHLVQRGPGWRVSRFRQISASFGNVRQPSGKDGRINMNRDVPGSLTAVPPGAERFGVLVLLERDREKFSVVRRFCRGGLARALVKRTLHQRLRYLGRGSVDR